MKAKVTEKSAQILDYISAGRLDEIIDNRRVELPVSRTEKLSFAARDVAIAIHFRSADRRDFPLALRV